MSLSCMGAVKLCGPREMVPFCVLLMIADEADDFGVAVLGQDRLAEVARCNQRTIMRAIEKLEDGGWICVKRRIWKNKCNAYFVNLGKIGVTLSPEARISPFHAALRKLHGDSLSPVFANKDAGFRVGGTKPEADASNGGDTSVSKPVDKSVDSFFSSERNSDSAKISGDFPQAGPVTLGRGIVTLETETSDKLCHLSHCPVSPVEGSPVFDAVPKGAPLPPAGGEEKFSKRGNFSPPATVQKPCGDEPRPPSEAMKNLFAKLKGQLKQELLGAPSHANFTPAAHGENDYDLYFRDWWLAWLDVVPSTLGGSAKLWLFMTEAGEPGWTAPGIAKYSQRLQRLAREVFRIPRPDEVRFEVRDRQETRKCA